MNPALHLQAVSAVLIAGEVDPKGQSVHERAKAIVLYFPARHELQVDPLAPENPAL